jgi:UDP-glucose 4-epimerase
VRVVVIGATGNIGTATVRALLADRQVTSVVGVARRLPPTPSDWPDRMTWVRADISRDALDVVEDADVVIHLAWKIRPSHDEDEMAATNVVGTRRVVEAVAAAAVPALVVASSVGAYGPGPKDRRVDESWPVTGIRTSAYSRHKAQVEQILDEAERDHPRLRLVRLRTSLAFQREAASEVHRIFLGRGKPWYVPRLLRLVPDIDELTFQATHTDDIADAYRRAALADVSGPFNIAAEPPLDPRSIARSVSGRLVPIPLNVLRFVVEASYRLRLQPTEAGWIDMATQTPLLDCTRARDLLGWRPTRSATDAFEELLAGMGDGAGGPTVPLEPRRGAAVS